MKKMRNEVRRIFLYIVMIGMVITERIIHPKRLSIEICLLGVGMFTLAIGYEFYKMYRGSETKPKSNKR